MESLLPLVIAAAAIGLMYFVCIRPMRRGQCGMLPQQHPDVSETERAAEIARLRAEIAELRRAPQEPADPDTVQPRTSVNHP